MQLPGAKVCVPVGSFGDVRSPLNPPTEATMLDISLVRDGYEVQVVADGGGSPSKMADDMALHRMAAAGVVLTSTNQLVAELAGNWTSPEGSQIVQVVMERLQG